MEDRCPGLPRGPRGLCLNWPFLWASSMAARRAGIWSPKRCRRLERLLSMECSCLLLASMDLWSPSSSLLLNRSNDFIAFQWVIKLMARKITTRYVNPVSYFNFPWSSMLWRYECWYCSICWPSVEVWWVRSSSAASICAIRSILAWLSAPVAWLMLEDQMSEAQTTHKWVLTWI